MPTRARLRIALDAWETYERLGSPEGELAIAQATVYMACAPKSNAVYVAFNAAWARCARHAARWKCRCTSAMRRRG